MTLLAICIPLSLGPCSDLVVGPLKTIVFAWITLPTSHPTPFLLLLADSARPFKSAPLCLQCSVLSLATIMVIPSSFWKGIVVLGSTLFFFHCKAKACRAGGQDGEDQVSSEEPSELNWTGWNQWFLKIYKCNPFGPLVNLSKTRKLRKKIFRIPLSAKILWFLKLLCCCYWIGR